MYQNIKKCKEYNMKKNKKPSFFRQTAVLTSRYFEIFFNDKQSLILTIAIPLLTILIVSFVASGDMFSVKTDIDHSINDGFPVLAWQQVDQEKDDEFALTETGIGNINDDKNTYLYIIFSENEYKSISEETFAVKDNMGNSIAEITQNIKIIDHNNGIYSAYAALDDELDQGNTYDITFSADVELKNSQKVKRYTNEYSLYINEKYEDVTDLVTQPGYAYDKFDTLDQNFDLNDYVLENQQQIAALSNSLMNINGIDYVVINDAETLAFILSDKTDIAEYQNEDWYNYNYYLNSDIDLNDYDGAIPMGDTNNPYKGIFDGNGHVVKNLNIDTDFDNAGMFGVVEGTVKNLGIDSASIYTTASNAGAIAGKLKSGSIHNCFIKKSLVKADEGYVGGIAGCADPSEVFTEIYTCYVKDTIIESQGDYLGGLVGDSYNIKISACYAIPQIKSAEDSAYIGNIVGNSDSADSLKNIVYLVENSDFKAIGSSDDSTDNEENNVVSKSEEDLKEYSPMLSHSLANDENEYGFKKDGQLDVFGGTQTGLFMLVCVAIFVGICNSIQEICKERNILKREYMTNLNLSSYTLSKLIVQSIVCAVQMIIVLLIFSLFIGNKGLYSSGVIFNSIWTEYFITMFLLAFSADTLALVISAIVKNSSTANTFIPIILIVQIVFSGVLFDLGDQMNNFASLMISKWGIAGLAISSRLNDARTQFLLDSPNYELQLGSSMSSVKDLYMSTANNLIMVWVILLAFIVACSVICTLLLTQVKKDRR